MKIRWKTLFVCILIPLAVGSLSALITRNGMEAFALVNKPALAPPNWLFPIVWTLLYTLMGFASYLIYTSKRPSQQALAAYGLQLTMPLFTIDAVSVGIYNVPNTCANSRKIIKIARPL